ncbi:MAG: PEP-CTERM sorting domain-containing protein [Pseudomonadota bacterium]
MMIRTIKSLAFATAIACSAHSVAAPITYEVASYSTGGYSASWLHGADACVGQGPSGGALYMCPSDPDELHSLTGVINGNLEDGVLTITSGLLNASGFGDIEITGGRLGGNFDTAWNIDTSIGNFLFENLAMGAGLPNLFDGTQMVLWGQNDAAYQQSEGGWGVDIFASVVSTPGGTPQSVPEPGAVGLLILGGLALYGSQRRRRAITSERRNQQ